MARRAAKAKPAKTLEQTLWDAADKLRGNQEPSEYKHVVLGLVFLKYVSDRFEERREQLKDELAAEGIKPERIESFLAVSYTQLKLTTTCVRSITLCTQKQ